MKYTLGINLKSTEKDFVAHVSESDKNRIEDCLFSGEKFILLTDFQGNTHLWSTDYLVVLMFMPEKDSEEEK